MKSYMLKIDWWMSKRVFLRTWILVPLVLFGVFISGMVMTRAQDDPYSWREDFDAGINEPWYWVNEVPSEWSISEGYLRIYASPYGASEQNLLLRPVEAGDFMVMTRVLFEPDTNYQFAGLVIYQDEENFFQLGRAFCDNVDTCVGNGIYFDKVVTGTLQDSNFATQVADLSEAYLRLDRQGFALKAFYSDDGISWTNIGAHMLPVGFQVNGVGVSASQDITTSDTDIYADFDFIEGHMWHSHPGTVYRYVDTFGESGVPYLADTDHLYNPVGLGVDGSGSIWVAELAGARVLKYNSSGTFQMSLGTAGLSYLADENNFAAPTDVSVDHAGNIWVVDANANRVVKYDPEGNFLNQLGVTWEAGTGNGYFDYPFGIAFDSHDNIYVSDLRNHRIQIFDSSGVYSTTLGVPGEAGVGMDHFDSPLHIAIDARDYLYVADTHNHRVQIFYPQHAYFDTLGESGDFGSDNDHFYYPGGVAVDDDYIYVNDDGNFRVQIFLRATLAYQFTLGGGSGNYAFDWPQDVAVDPSGNIYVADMLNQRVQKFTPSRFYDNTRGTPDVPYLTDAYHYNQPGKVAVDNDGNIGILEDEGRGHRFIKLDAEGGPLVTIGEAGISGSDNEHFSDARGLTFADNGDIYIGDCANHRIQIYTKSGSYKTTLGNGLGQGDDQFYCPTGLTFDSTGNLYVADTLNHRVQVFDHTLTYSTTIGITGEAGPENDHFYEPHDVAVDADGNIYVADLFNHRVQKFDSSYAWKMTLGVTGECGYDFAHFCEPYGVAVDDVGNVYVVQKFGPRVQVFDQKGAYLTTVGGTWGGLNGQMREPLGLDVDADRNIFIADTLNHRILKYALGVPEWKQINFNGFDKPSSRGVTALEVFQGQLYAGVSDWYVGGQIYRQDDDIDWHLVTSPGFESTQAHNNPAITDLAVFNNQLYAGTGWGGANGQVWRSPDGMTWEPVTTNGFGDGANGSVSTFTVFNGLLYAGTGNTTSGAQIWRSPSGDSGDWIQVAPDVTGTENAYQVTALAAFRGSLYAALETNVESPSPAQVWRSSDGSSWDTVISDGFDDANNTQALGFAEFGGYLYLGTLNEVTGAQLWRTADGTIWLPVISDGFGDSSNLKVDMLSVFAGSLYAGVANAETGIQIWRSNNDLYWEQVNPDGFGDSNNVATMWNNSIAVLDGYMHLSTWNDANGGELWMFNLQEQTIFLPMVMRVWP